MTIERCALLLNIVVLISMTTRIAAANEKDDNGGDTSLIFNLKLINVGSSSAQFELLDNNVTTINYKIVYTVTSNNSTANHQTRFVSYEGSEELQTNSMTLLAEQQRLLSDDDSAESLMLSKPKDDLGEIYTAKKIERIHNKRYEEVHRFEIDDLEANREYDIVFSITATEAFLSPTITGRSETHRPRQTQKQIHFKFKTTYDYHSAATLACRNSLSSASDTLQSLDPVASCYLEGTNCTQCKSNCYHVRNPATTSDKNSEDSKIILCEACPCDTSRSTGACEVVPPASASSSSSSSSDSVVLASYPQIKCKQCIEPYVGDRCNDCQNEGIDYYKNERGECVKCFCNNNAALDAINPSSSSSSSSSLSVRRRKCNSITGVCIDCMFNTTGRNCDKCAPGFVGDAIKRTCVRQSVPVQPAASTPFSSSSRNGFASSNANDRFGSPMTIDPNEKYTYKSLALFSIYIFCAFGLLIFTFLCIKSRSLSRQHMLKNGASQCSSGAAATAASDSLRTHVRSLVDSIDQSTKSVRSRIAIYFGSICPTTMRFVRVASNQPTTGDGTALGSNDDDRLNLAEYQMFDDTLLNVNVDEGAFTYRATFTDLDDTQGDNRNPYRSLTVKT